MTVIPDYEHGPAYLLALLIASSKTFRDCTGTEDVNTALARVFWPLAEEGDSPPRAVISDISDFTQQGFSNPATGIWRLDGESLIMTFDLVVPSEYANVTPHPVKNSWAWFTKNVKQILKEMRQLAGKGNSGVNNTTHFNMTEHRKIGGPEEWSQTEVNNEELPDPADGKPPIVWTVSYEVAHR